MSGFTPIGGSPLATTAKITDGTFDKNEARGQFSGDGWGGAIFSDVLSNVTIMRGNYTNNLAYSQGGALFTQDNLSIREGAFTTNKSNGSGGALSALGPKTKSIVQTKFARNISGDNSGDGGGAIDMYGPFTMKNITLRGNTARVGGGIRLKGSLGTMQFMLIEDNIASSDGGGVAVAPGDAAAVTSLLDSTVQRNKAGLNGGGVFNAAEMIVSNIKSSQIRHLQATRWHLQLSIEELFGDELHGNW